MDKHTPGPWKTFDSAPYVSIGEEGPVIGVVTYDADMPQETYYANARLMAASPDLLETCYEALRVVAPTHPDLCDRLIAVIRKAIGTDDPATHP